MKKNIDVYKDYDKNLIIDLLYIKYLKFLCISKIFGISFE